MPNGSSIQTYFRTALDATAHALEPRMVPYATIDEGVADVRSGKLVAFIADYPVAQYQTQQPNPANDKCDLTLASERFGPGALIIGLQQDSPLAPNLTSALLMLAEEGVLADLRRKWFVELSLCQLDESSSADTSSLGLNQLWSIFLILVAGAGAAILWAAVEIIYFNKFFGRDHAAARRLHAATEKAQDAFAGSFRLRG